MHHEIQLCIMYLYLFLQGTRRNLNFDKKTKSAPSSGRSTPTSVRSGRGSKPGTPRESTPELSTRSKRTSLNTGGDSSTSKKTGGRRSKETANTRRSAETAGRSVEKGKGRQSVEKTSTRRSAGNKRGRSSEPSEDEEGMSNTTLYCSLVMVKRYLYKYTVKVILNNHFLGELLSETANVPNLATVNRALRRHQLLYS